jgi:hypothetical protein
LVGRSADRQVAVHRKAVAEGATAEEARRAVVDWLVQETKAGLSG